MQPRHLLLALTIVFFWGVNFAIIKLGLRQVSPLALGVARFTLAALPWIFFVRRPKAPLSLIALYSLFIFALQFGLLFTAMQVGMSAGLSSLLLQLQVFFTIGLSVAVLGERPNVWQALGALIAFGGIGVVAAHVGGDITFRGLMLLVAAAAAWGAGNIVSRIISNRYGSEDMLGLVCWGSLLAVPPLLLVALLLEPDAFVRSFTHLDWVSLGSVAYIVYISTLFGFAAWSRLLGIYPVATVAPFTLLVPVFGFLGSAVLLGEPMEPWKFAAAALVIAGLVVNLFGGRLAHILRR
ncbi:MAG: EamA family transporter [Rhizobiaceae bacterium]|nr:EamA family transporter [Rhizobiaceae bacterium]